MRSNASSAPLATSARSASGRSSRRTSTLRAPRVGEPPHDAHRRVRVEHDEVGRERGERRDQRRLLERLRERRVDAQRIGVRLERGAAGAGRSRGRRAASSDGVARVRETSSCTPGTSAGSSAARLTRAHEVPEADAVDRVERDAQRPRRARHRRPPPVATPGVSSVVSPVTRSISALGGAIGAAGSSPGTRAVSIHASAAAIAASSVLVERACEPGGGEPRRARRPDRRTAAAARTAPPARAPSRARAPCCSPRARTRRRTRRGTAAAARSAAPRIGEPGAAARSAASGPSASTGATSGASPDRLGDRRRARGGLDVAAAARGDEHRAPVAEPERARGRPSRRAPAGLAERDRRDVHDRDRQGRVRRRSDRRRRSRGRSRASPRDRRIVAELGDARRTSARFARRPRPRELAVRARRKRIDDDEIRREALGDAVDDRAREPAPLGVGEARAPRRRRCRQPARPRAARRQQRVGLRRRGEHAAQRDAPAGRHPREPARDRDRARDVARGEPVVRDEQDAERAGASRDVVVVTARRERGERRPRAAASRSRSTM